MVEETQKIIAEGKNHRQFFNNRTYHDTGEPVGSDTHWILQIIEDEAPMDREENYKFYYVYQSPTNIETADIDDPDDSFEYRLDRVYALEPEDDHQWCIDEKNDFDSLDELFTFTQEYNK